MKKLIIALSLLGTVGLANAQSPQCARLIALESQIQSAISSAELSVYTAAPGDRNQARLIPQLTQQLFNIQLKLAELGCR